jgi:acyl-CoA thioesterase I
MAGDPADMAFSWSPYKPIWTYMRRIQTTFAFKAWIIAATILASGGTAIASEPSVSGASAAEPFHIVALGDSLSAGYLLPPGAGFPEQLGRALTEKGHHVTVMNAGVSGDTSTGGLARLDWAVSPATNAVIVELGSNDALRGIEPEVTRANLDSIVQQLTDRDIKVLIAGMLAPPNMGDDYAADFNGIFADLSEKYDVLLYPFFLDGVAAERHLNLADGMHPTEEGVGVIVERILPLVEQLIEALPEETAAIN